MDSLNDMQLVEQAAKAAGYGIARWSDDGHGLLLVGVQDPWNPLEDDGDALRLAMKLCMEIAAVEGGGVNAIRWLDDGVELFVGERSNDVSKDARRAITRAAAAMRRAAPTVGAA